MRVRIAASMYLADLRRRFGDELPRRHLERGFVFDGQPVALVGPPGIWRPAALPEMPISILTAPPTDRKPRRYDDELGIDGRIIYRYQGSDPLNHYNSALRLAGERRVPLVYFFGTAEGWYEATWPVYVVNDEPGKLTFTLAVEQQGTLFASTEEPESDVLERRRYVTRQVQQRLHQRLFRGQVIEAYAERCTICRLRHRELLDAAHILADTDARGQPSISNGLAMCKLHHSAYDRNVLGISPELVVHVRQDVLSESDGPMLIHGLQGFQGGRLYLPRRAEERPNREFLEERYDQFRRAS